jgi:hypothetical protein
VVARRAGACLLTAPIVTPCSAPWATDIIIPLGTKPVCPRGRVACFSWVTRPHHATVAHTPVYLLAPARPVPGQPSLAEAGPAASCSERWRGGCSRARRFCWCSAVGQGEVRSARCRAAGPGPAPVAQQALRRLALLGGHRHEQGHDARHPGEVAKLVGSITFPMTVGPPGSTGHEPRRNDSGDDEDRREKRAQVHRRAYATSRRSSRPSLGDAR